MAIKLPPEGREERGGSSANLLDEPERASFGL